MVDWTMYVSLQEAHTLEGKTSHQRGSCKCLCTIRCALRQVEASHLSCPVPTSRQTQPVMAGGLPPQGQVSQWDLPVSVSVKPRREQDPVRAPPCLPPNCPLAPSQTLHANRRWVLSSGTSEPHTGDCSHLLNEPDLRRASFLISFSSSSNVTSPEGLSLTYLLNWPVFPALQAHVHYHRGCCIFFIV